MTSSGEPPHTSSVSAISLDRRSRLWQAALGEVKPLDRVLLSIDSPGCAEAVQAIGAQLQDQQVTVVICTPSDALRLPIPPDSEVRLVVLHGEVGGHVPSTRGRIEERFGARCVDVYGLRELGIVAWDCAHNHLHVSDAEFKADIADGELVLDGYRTGDVARFDPEPCACGRRSLTVPGRGKDRLSVRGVELYPGDVENVVRRHPAVTEYRLCTYQVRGQCQLAIEIEPAEAVATEGDRARVAAEVAQDIKASLGLRLQCEPVPPGALPRDDPRPRRVVHR